MKDLVKLLEKNNNVDEFLINKQNITSTELFFIKNELQMNRAKNVEKINVTVYKNYEIDGTKFKGSSTTKINPTDTVEEIDKKISTAALAASFVKNPYYELEQPSNEEAPVITSAFGEGDAINIISNLVKDLYEEDNQFGSFINSTEFFIDTRENHLINSNGIDVEYTSYRGEIELITEANGEKESIELYDTIDFSDYDQKELKQTITESLENASLRAKAIPMPQVENLPVIFRGAACKRLWDYYGFCASGRSKYEKLHENNIGDNIQGEEVLGDHVTLVSKPAIPNSTTNRYYDNYGTFLKEYKIIDKGVIKTMTADKRFAYYLDIEPTGGISNQIVSGGTHTLKELHDGPYLEILTFSAFQMDAMTGFFGGEFRLGIYFDGEQKIPVTLGSVSANIKEAQKEMFMSTEQVKVNNFIGPKLIKFNKVTIAGN